MTITMRTKKSPKVWASECKLKMPNIQFTYDEERLEALKVFLEEKGKNLDTELKSMLDNLYEKTVPQKVQTFLERKSKTETQRPKQKA